MKKIFLLLLILTLVIASKGVADMAGKKLVYQINWSSTNVTGKIILNGFEIGSLDGDQATGFPASLWLIGQNTLEVELSKKDTKNPSAFSLNVSELELGEVTSTDDTGNLASLNLTDADFKTKKVKKSIEFKSSFDFSEHLLGPTPEAKAVTEYAAKLYQLFAKKDAQGLAKEFSIKVEDSSKAYYQKIAPEQFVEMLANDLLQDKLVKVEPKNIKVKKANAQGSLWQVYNGDQELIKTTSADGATSTLPLYIGLVNGQLTIIR